MDLEQFFRDEMDRHDAAAKATRDSLSAAFAEWVTITRKALENGNKIVFYGNGGSASDAQHLATELTVRYRKNRRALAALSLATDTSALTAIGNDLGFDEVFARQVAALCQKGDVAVAISTSGTSPNVLRAIAAGREIGVTHVALTGRDGGQMRALCDLAIVVPAADTASIQEMHITLGHMLCAAMEEIFADGTAS